MGDVLKPTVGHSWLLLSSMKISQDIRREHGGSRGEIEEGMAQKSKEFAASGNRVYLPIAD